MGVCQLCKKEVEIPFRCNYCGQQFCSEHRLPENHLCPGNYEVRSRKQLVRKHDGFSKDTGSSFIRVGSRRSKKHDYRVKKKEGGRLGAIVFIVICIVVIGYFSILENKGDILGQINEELDKVNVWDPENVYGNYSFGLVRSSDAVSVNSYGDYIVLINNNNAVNPSYSQLTSFLKKDKTDEYPYQYVITSSNTRYGTAESNVNTTLIKEIIDGKRDMKPPRICADFAEVLHNKAELAGFICGYVSVDLIGYKDPYGLGIPENTSHALVVFNTKDKGLIYIDDTGGINNRISNYDKVINNLKIGGYYIPESLFPRPGWKSTWGNMGKVTKIEIIWEGDWD